MTAAGRPVQCCTLCPEVEKFAHGRLPLDTILDFAGLSYSTLMHLLVDHGHEDIARQYGATFIGDTPADVLPDQLTLNLGDNTP